MEKKYKLTTPISAVPMLRGDYNDLRGWITPENENAFDEGYYMTYPNNYKTWMSKASFENCFDPEPETFIDRLIAEKSEVDNRMDKLEEFIKGDKFKNIHPVQQSLLNIQANAMLTYSQILLERITHLSVS